MKNIKLTTLTIGLAAAATLFLVGCGDKDGADHGENADHDSDAAHVHSDGDNDAEHASLEGVAGKVETMAAGVLAVVANPTAEQLEGTKPYLLETCATSDEKLGGMGEPLLLLIGDQQIKLCCEDCLPDVKADPAKILAGIAKQ